MEKVLIHAYAEQNLGDDMFVEYLCRRYPFVSFCVYCREEYATAFRSISNLTILDLNEYHNYKDFCLQIVIGGSIFMQSSTKSVFKKYSVDKKRLIPNIDTYIIGANFGPYQSGFFLYLYKHWFKSLNEISFRDKYSYDLFHLSNMRWAPDILLNYSLPKTFPRKAISISCIKKSIRSGLGDYNESAYFQKLAHISKCYSQLGYKIVLACFSKEQGDDIAAKIIYNLLPPHVQSTTEIIVYNGMIENFLKIFLSSVYIVGTRFHSIILGWNAGIPAFPICYNSKLEHAIKSYGFEGNFIDIDKIDTVDFAYIDSNREPPKMIPRQTMSEEANKHFLSLDSIFREKRNVQI